MDYGSIYFWLAVVLVLARISALIERLGQPAVMGELVVGIILGNITVGGLSYAEPVNHDVIFKFLSELGVVILLFEVGLDSKVVEIRQLGFRVFGVACTGVAVPFLLGYSIIAPMCAPEMESEARLFVGAMLTATSVGFTARVFQDLGQHKSKEARIFLGAAVIDDVLALSILAVVGAILDSAAIHPTRIVWIVGKAVAFFGAAVLLGQLLAPRLGRLLSRIHPGVGMKFILPSVFA